MIKKLAKEEIPELLPIRRKKETLLSVMLRSLELGEGLELPDEDWKRKNSPAYVIAWLKKKKGLRFEYGRNAKNNGWLFRRIK